MSKKFKSQDYFRFKKLGKRWRRPAGLQSKLRIKKGGSGRKVSIGYGSSGKPLPALIFSERDFGKDCSNGILIGSSVGSKKAAVLAAKAKELGVTVLNMRKVKRANRLGTSLKKKSQEKKSVKEKAEKSKKDKEKAEQHDAKKIGFDEDVVPQVIDGKKSTYRIRDHKLKAGDKVAFENTQAGEIFGHAVIADVQHIKVKDIDLKDPAHYKIYNTTEELVGAFKLRNPEKTVTPETEAFVYTYEFTPVKSAGEK